MRVRSCHRKTASHESGKTTHKLYETFELYFGCCLLILRPKGPYPLGDS